METFSFAQESYYDEEEGEEGESQYTDEEGESQFSGEEGESQYSDEEEGESQYSGEEEGESQYTDEEGESQFSGEEEGESQYSNEYDDEVSAFGVRAVAVLFSSFSLTFLCSSRRALLVAMSSRTSATVITPKDLTTLKKKTH